VRRLLRPIAIALAAAGLAVAGCGGADALKEQPRAARSGGAPAPFSLSARATTSPARHPWRWLTAQVTRRVALRARPDGAVVARLATRTEFGSPKVLGVVRRRGAWLQVTAPERPNGRDGWIPADAARLAGTDLSIVVRRSRRVLELRRGARVLRRMPVAVGRPGNETPLGRFSVTDRLRTTRADSPYGCCALALSGHQPRLVAGWPGGDRLAIHGTPEAGSIGEAVSLGCLRAPRRGIRALLRVVPAGVPVFVRR
jgi:lipoprotein-anchoring transpeptidase ErfK/SrfK